MNKIALVIKREYLTRVRKKSFIIMTLLGPILFVGLMIVPIWLTSLGGSDQTVLVLDESALFTNKFDNTKHVFYEDVKAPLDEAKKLVKEDVNLLYIPPLNISKKNIKGVVFYSKGNPSLQVIQNIQRTLDQEVEDIKLKEAGIDKEMLSELQANVLIDKKNVEGTEEKASSASVPSILGYICAIMIYMFIFYYGTQIMRGVIEEKTNRIIEVMVSSIRPFQLLMGKIIGIAAVGLTQFLLWGMLTLSVATGVGSYFQWNKIKEISTSAAMEETSVIQSSQMHQIGEVIKSIESIDFNMLIITFVFYFFGGYLLYGALFAAIGSAVDSDTDYQQFLLPITIPLVTAIISLGAIINDPHGPLAVWLSSIPFTSPVVMMMRIPFGTPPLWQLVLSAFLLVGGFVFTTWLASRIYRIGILVHGTKVNYKTLWKWLMMNN